MKSRVSDYELLQNIQSSLNRMEDKFDDRLKDMDAKVERLEAFQNKALGILGISSGFLTLLINYVWQRVTDGK